MDRRTLLIGLSSGVAVAATQTQAASRLNAAATRLDPAKVRLTWNASAGSARVLTSSEPNANLFAMKEIAAAVQNGQLDVAAAISPRPYFLIRECRRAAVAQNLKVGGDRASAGVIPIDPRRHEWIHARRKAGRDDLPTLRRCACCVVDAGVGSDLAHRGIEPEDAVRVARVAVE